MFYTHKTEQENLFTKIGVFRNSTPRDPVSVLRYADRPVKPFFSEVRRIFFSETSVYIYQSIRRNTEDDLTVYLYRSKNLESSKPIVSYILIS